MKSILIFCVLMVSLSCNEIEDNTSMVPVTDDFDPGSMDVMLLKEGVIEGVGHTASGTAKIYREGNNSVIVLDPFNSQNGPDLKVYLSSDEKATKYLNLGPLKSTTGKQSYDVTGMPDLSEYKFVLIWCEQFSVLFAKAELQ